MNDGHRIRLLWSETGDGAVPFTLQHSALCQEGGFNRSLQHLQSRRRYKEPSGVATSLACCCECKVDLRNAFRTRCNPTFLREQVCIGTFFAGLGRAIYKKCLNQPAFAELLG